ncbi:MAG: DNA primase catalytic subunit PriS [Theionarchaea archaeon]|nr:DNA primase catalytic subunit PriS [Theionarchaea archaeon]MBU7000892.1 DNA primase catalytic subunit PriS [Theionarchaea archaeon]MBU7019895.1 DNA primase catalytic subunit PriS [Theionarchaea archaeon]MBU7035968.1 DNA primase catalytic subunit PriS [Theionarchaea archaeon]MBU7041812.1 DNA primase catalytic subunit PriS [Theionarchaea archaeon]
MEFREATLQDRREYFAREWNPHFLPPFITEYFRFLEFAFDNDGTGPNDRYNAFSSLEELSSRIRKTAPYAVYSSVSHYEVPSQREGWLRAELVFDIDARDLPARRCECKPGKVCETCLEDARDVALTLIDTLKESFGVNKLFLIYSGRGYHVRCTDEEAMSIRNRGSVFTFVTGSRVPPDLFMVKGYPSAFRKMSSVTFSKMKSLAMRGGSTHLQNRDSIIEALINRDKVRLEEIIKKKALESLLEELSLVNAESVDGKCTVDIKRILRLPTSLHSKVSMICTVVRDWEKFDPVRDATPQFVKAR